MTDCAMHFRLCMRAFMNQIRIDIGVFASAGIAFVYLLLSGLSMMPLMHCNGEIVEYVLELLGMLALEYTRNAERFVDTLL